MTAPLGHADVIKALRTTGWQDQGGIQSTLYRAVSTARAPPIKRRWRFKTAQLGVDLSYRLPLGVGLGCLARVDTCGSFLLGLGAVGTGV